MLRLLSGVESHGKCYMHWILYSSSKEGYYILADSDHQVSEAGGRGWGVFGPQPDPKNKGSRSRG